MKSIIAALLLATCGMHPALAQGVKCYDAVEALNKLIEEGYEITFGDNSGKSMVFLLEDGNGGWFLASVSDEVLCVHASGLSGVHSPQKPNV